MLAQAPAQDAVSATLIRARHAALRQADQIFAQGVRAGAAAALGISAGCSVHIATAALGVGALLAGSAQHSPSNSWIGMWAAIGFRQNKHGKAIYSEQRRGWRARKIARLRNNC